MKIKVPNCMAVAVQDRRWFVVRVKGGMSDGVFAELGEAGYDAFTIAALMGHSQIQTTARYVRATERNKRAAVPDYAILLAKMRSLH